VQAQLLNQNRLMKTKKEIFKDILISAQTGSVLKIKLKDQPNPVITAVDHISKNKIVLKPTCLYGYRVARRNITLLEIEAVTRYRTQFDHPLFQKLRFIKDNLSAIRKDFETFNDQPSLSNTWR
jgi:hypothetical protein